MLKKIIVLISLIIFSALNVKCETIKFEDSETQITLDQETLESIETNGFAKIPVNLNIFCRPGVTGAGTKIGTINFSRSNRICDVYLSKKITDPTAPFILPQAGKYTGGSI